MVFKGQALILHCKENELFIYHQFLLNLLYFTKKWQLLTLDID